MTTSTGSMGNGAILLPVAYHSHSHGEIIQVVGPPQTVIPIAISRSATLNVNFTPRPLMIDASLAPNLDLCASAIVLGHAGKAPFHLPIAATPQCLETHCAASIPTTSQCASTSSATPPSLSAPARIETDEPLDLSVRPKGNGSENGGFVVKQTKTANPSPASPPRKRLLCDCGLSFLAAETLEGHQSYYCRNRVPNESALLKSSILPPASRKKAHSTLAAPIVPLNQCSAHVTHGAENRERELTCPLCGYKGYSLRGAKIHLRVAHAADHLDVNGLANLFLEISKGVKPFSTAKDRLSKSSSVP